LPSAASAIVSLEHLETRVLTVCGGSRGAHLEFGRKKVAPEQSGEGRTGLQRRSDEFKRKSGGESSSREGGVKERE
jgi:hypothetical protein